MNNSINCSQQKQLLKYFVTGLQYNSLSPLSMLSFPGTLSYITDVSNLRKQKDKVSCQARVTSGPLFPLSSLSPGWPGDL